MMSEKNMKRLRNTLLLAVGMSLMFIHEAQCSKALDTFTNGTTAISKLVAGPLGSLALISASLVGGYQQLMSGNTYRAAGIVLVGIMMGWHFDSILKMFG